MERRGGGRISFGLDVAEEVEVANLRWRKGMGETGEGGEGNKHQV